MLQNFSNKKITIAVLIILIVFVLPLILISSHKKTATTNSTARSTLSPDALLVVKKYLQARENNVGADQATPNSWLTTIQPLVTTSWFSQLQPNPDPTTSSASNDYNVAHQSNYIVKAIVSNCGWSNNLTQQTATQGTIVCGLSDTTVDRVTNATIPALTLPFGWTHNGQQTSPVLELINQNGHWLINNDATGQGQ